MIEGPIFDWQVTGGTDGDLTGSKAAEVAVLGGAWSGDVAGVLTVETDWDDGDDVLDVVIVVVEVVVGWKLLGQHLILRCRDVGVDRCDGRSVGVASVGTWADVVGSVGDVGDWLGHDDGLDWFDGLFSLDVALAGESSGAGRVAVVWRWTITLLLSVVQPDEQLEKGTDEEQCTNDNISW